ncbi:hypothetical protein F3Y22_tig00111689pilonHSYRG00039 [Hibiscus syriacus]|uniref:Uncharacterized protein n=1 Tax=Hibiscus syriacus TaxID=106335 RepID=A0A6A2XI90_HIBSY|nr:hypothetical protein F3Y22_tig00111689pilonHSYRG00039 [Hibiscus syriacus]
MSEGATNKLGLKIEKGQSGGLKPSILKKSPLWERCGWYNSSRIWFDRFIKVVITYGYRDDEEEMIKLKRVSVEGLQTLKPQVERSTLQDASLANGFKESLKIFGGINLEVHMVVSEDNFEDEIVNWVVENFKFSVKQPFEKSLGKDTIDKLGNLGIEEIFTPKCSQGSGFGSFGLSPSYKLMTEDQRTTLALLEELVSDSQAKCAALVTKSSNSEFFQVNPTYIEDLSRTG